MISMLAIGDFGEPTPLRKEAIDAILSYDSPVDAVLALGDNFYDRGVSSVDDPRWEEWRRAFRPSCPWVAVLGNHDYLGNIRAQIEYKKDNWYMPARFYDRRFPFVENSGDCGVHVFASTRSSSPRTSRP